MLVSSSVASAAEVSVAFRVKAPPSTPADAKLYLAGDAEQLGAWKEDGVELTRGEDGVHAAKVTLPADREVQYKVTRGSWGTVEKNADGSELANRTFRPTKDATVEIEVAAWADQLAAAATPASTASGDIRVHEKFASKHLGNERRLLVWLPPGYEQDAARRYDVLYMHDGQNLFDAATSLSGEWKADETAKQLIERKTIRPIIIVGIANNSQRIDEYTLTRDDRRGAGGSGAKYMKFVAEEVKPFIDATYRTNNGRESAGVAGSSLGGTISLEICRAYPQTFGLCAALSPAAWWNGGEMLARLEKDLSWTTGTRIWVDTGTKEGEGPQQGAYVDSVRRIDAMLKKAGLVEGKHYRAKVVDGAEHNEQAWAARFGDVLMFLFPPE